MQPQYTRAVVNRLKTVRGHLDGVIQGRVVAMVGDGINDPPAHLLQYDVL